MSQDAWRAVMLILIISCVIWFWLIVIDIVRHLV